MRNTKYYIADIGFLGMLFPDQRKQYKSFEAAYKKCEKQNEESGIGTFYVVVDQKGIYKHKDALAAHKRLLRIHKIQQHLKTPLNDSQNFYEI